MDWTQVIFLFLGNVALIGWLRADIKEVREVQSEDRKELLSILRSMQEEQKDFHGRLCAIEERNKGKS